jgi:AhpD family alkylhydroperoxidase
MSTQVRVFDPAMCCSTGVCGPSVDPALARFSADLDWLKSRDVSVERFNLAQQPAAFVEHASVKQALDASGEAALPLILVNGAVKSAGTYPTREQLAEWAGVTKPAPSMFTEAVGELVAIGAAIASNCEPCFKFHYDKAKKLGISPEDMQQAVSVAQAVKEAPARAVLDLAARYLPQNAAPPAKPSAVAAVVATSAGGCCAPQAMPLEIKKSKCC